ncbi:YbhB/YbcL family Raf kinase inhibitor-like protein [Methyloparacoccus murrellii]
MIDPRTHPGLRAAGQAALLTGFLLATPSFGANTLQLTSTAFLDQGDIPVLHTCEGRDLSPPLQWQGIPGGTQSLALIVEDPDAPDPAAPRMTWVHWVLYNLPVSTGGLAEALTAATLPAGAREGLNDWQRTGYGGPCPPIGRHRYFHTLYALDTVLPDLHHPSKAALAKAMAGHVLGVATLVGTYRKSR